MQHRLRIIGGSARGRWLYSPESETTRPMLGRTKNSLFNILQPRLSGARVLDLFAGTGQLGLEALSRGANSCLFTEKNRGSFLIIRKNIERLGFTAQSQVVLWDAFDIIRLLKRLSFHPDIVFIAPPYKFWEENRPERTNLMEIMDEMAKENIISKDGLIIMEHLAKQFQPVRVVKHLSVLRQRGYGQTALTFLSPIIDPVRDK